MIGLVLGDTHIGNLIIQRLKLLKKNFVIVTPGIRPIKDKLSDQKRVMSPKEAIREGSSYIVVGRPILEATSPLRAAENIIKEMKNVKS